LEFTTIVNHLFTNHD